MNTYELDLEEEKSYLEKTVTFLENEILYKDNALISMKQKLIAARKDMWENTGHSGHDFTKTTEMNQYLSEVNSQTMYYLNAAQLVDRYKKMIVSPYFGRFDFSEEGLDRDSIYIGLANVMNRTTSEVYVYDWRAPISSIFYRYELGKASYTAPSGIISGEVLLKRQYKIKNSELKYFFDCSLRITDDMLQDVLKRNSSPKMRNIVETIQREQDIIIRDTDNDLLIVQGVAGSGKTSIALHRIAFLLYHGLNSKIKSNDFIIISPHTLFSSYLSNVLPELGEDNVKQITFDKLITLSLKDRFYPETKHQYLESLFCTNDYNKSRFRRSHMEFKNSLIFLQILERLLHHYAHTMINFTDAFYNGTLLATKQELKARFLNNKIDIPMAKQLYRIEQMLLEKLHPHQKKRLKKIEDIVAQRPEHQLEIKSFSRLLSIKETKKLLERIHKFTRIDYWNIYKSLFDDPLLFFKLARGLDLPEDIESIIENTKQSLARSEIPYEDCAPLIYLILKTEGSDMFTDIKHVVIDEAQDYHPLQYEIFKMLFRNAKYTVLGDVQQALGRTAEFSLYDEAAKILEKEKYLKLFLHKSYRSSYEINTFSKKILNEINTSISFERHGKAPQIIYKQTAEELDETIIGDIKTYLQEGNKNIALICKNKAQTESIHLRIHKKVNIKLVTPDDNILCDGVMAIPAYLAKGLEFDAVLIYGVDHNNYSNEQDRRLLYVACTRALHRLTLYHSEELSPFLS
ncbi:MAG: ATP-dependent DNA helicase [Firmicutes bacterium HGW-Firmicutes-12]|jgi:DNA helicase-2/ATP-dependent DNA helicase PcrA|nr:MAG: ATP-dependent DNA helicase [Firmicutes bacterium HGW-Firmicutes-12]